MSVSWREKCHFWDELVNTIFIYFVCCSWVFFSLHFYIRLALFDGSKFIIHIDLFDDDDDDEVASSDKSKSKITLHMDV